MDRLEPFLKVDIHAGQHKWKFPKTPSIPFTVNQFGLMVNPFFTKETVKDFESASATDTKKFSKFFWAMAENGLYIPPSQFEAWFLPIIMTDEELNKVKARIEKAFEAIK